MLTQINFFLLLYLISYILNQSIDYESACKNIYIASKKDCSVAPWNNNYRCCYIKYNGGGECDYIYDSAKKIKEKINDYKNLGKSNVKIQCDSFFIKRNVIFISVVVFFIFYLF